MTESTQHIINYMKNHEKCTATSFALRKEKIT